MAVEYLLLLNQGGINGDQEAAFAHAQLVAGQRSKGKNSPWSSGQGLFSTVISLDCCRSSGHGAYGSDPALTSDPPSCEYNVCQ